MKQKNIFFDKDIIVNQSKMNFSQDIQYTLQEGDSKINFTNNIMPSEIAQKNPQSKFLLNDSCANNSKRKLQQSNQYNWNDTQNKRYIGFIVKQRELLGRSIQQRKKSKVNVLMSRAIKTRTSIQCRTHHQKMIEKYGTLQNVIKEFQHLLSQSRSPNKEQDYSLPTNNSQASSQFEQISQQTFQKVNFESLRQIQKLGVDDYQMKMIDEQMSLQLFKGQYFFINEEPSFSDLFCL